MESLILHDIIDLETLPPIRPKVRNTLLKWIGKACSSPNRRGKTEDGREYELIFPMEYKTCILRCDDGALLMPAIKIRFISTREAERKVTV